MEIEFYPNNEEEFKNKCKESKELYRVAYKGENIFYHYLTKTKGNFNSPLKTYLKTCSINGEKIINIPGITKLRAFASDEFLQEGGDFLEKVLFAKDFYFDKVGALWKIFLDTDISQKEMEDIQSKISKSFVKNGGKYKGLLDYYKHENKKLYKFLELTGKLIAIFDESAANKKELNPYKDKRTVANSSVHQQDWIKNLLKHKENKKASESVNSTIKYIKDPVENTSILKKEHRSKISQKLLNKEYDSHNFVSELKKYFKANDIYIETKNKSNQTLLITKILYGVLKNKWNEKEGLIMTKQLQQSTKLLTHKKQIILQGSPGTGKTRLAKDVAYYFITKGILSNDENERQEQLKTLTQSNQVTQKNTNKTDIAFQDYLKDGQKIDTTSGSSFFTIVEITQNHVSIKLKDGAGYNVLKNKVLDRLNNQNWTTGNGLSSYEAGIAKYIFDKQNEEIVVSENISLNLEQYKLIQFHPAYTYEDFVRGIVATTDGNGNINYEVKNKVLAEMAENAKNNPGNPFVLIIDEINRANLSSVLGELIYALEYRGEVVEGMYEYQGSRKIVLPENLYIIGTMNTADRSVGHIDYAIRRRFAFVDVNTDESVISDKKSKSLFKKVKGLFKKHLSDEFELNDVMIGHSYFLKNNLRLALEYEIKPMLQEYRKDGVLTCEKEKIEELKIEG